MTRRTSEQLPLFALAACLVVEVVTYYCSGFTITDHDHLVMSEVARRVLDGEALYREAWDNKPPLALLFYVPVQAVAPGSYLGLQLFGAVWTAIQAALAFALLRGESTLVRSLAGSLVLLLPLSRDDFVWVSSEDAVNLFALALTLIAYRLARRGDWRTWELVLAGILGALAFHCRQTGVIFVVPVALFVLVSPQNGVQKARAMAGLACGAVVGLALTLAMVLPFTDVASYLQAMFVTPQRYVRSQGGAARFVLREHLMMLRDHSYFLIGAFALLVGERRERVLIALVALLSAAVILAPLREYGHYQEQLIPLLVLSAVVATRALERLSRPVALAYGAAVASLFVVNAGITAQTLRSDEGEMAELNSVVQAIETENLKTPGTVLAVGRRSAYIYFRTRVRPVHKYHWDYFFDADDILPVPPPSVLNDIIDRPPTWLAVDAVTLEKSQQTPAATRTAHLVQALCGVRICETVIRTDHWAVLRVPTKH